MKFTHSGAEYVISDACLATFAAHRQRSRLSKETGGQLFCQFNADHILLAHASETKGQSKRQRYGFWPDRAAEQADIQALFAQRLHYLGDWHTHPEQRPSPSPADREKMLAIFRESRHELQAMLMVIVGLADFPAGLFVGAANGAGVDVLTVIA